ncbi:MAG: MaoC/PaaZ C-terminal domain-containing protein [Gammaproteobacteria bacterium]
MPVHSSAVGRELCKQSVRVGKRQVLAYAAVLGETSAARFDDARPEGVTALPQFCVALEWPLAIAPETGAALGLAAGEARAVIHLRQDSEFHAGIRPGDSLSIASVLTGVRSTARGAIVSSRTDTSNTETGARVVTTHSDALFMGVAVDGGDASSDQAVKPSIEAMPQNPERTTVPVARELPHLYTECANIWNPIHTERTAALAAGLPDIILHGTATWALAGQAIARRYAHGDAGRLRRLAGEFSAIVIPGNDIVIEHAQSEADANLVLFTVLNHDGAPAIKNGFALLDRD